MRMWRTRRTPFGMPVIRELSIDGIQSRTIFLLRFLAIYVSDSPCRMRNRFSIGSKNVQLCNRSELLSIVSIQRLDTELPAFCSLRKMNFLRFRTFSKSPAICSAKSIKQQLTLRLVAVTKVKLRAQVIQHRLIQADHHGFLRAYQAENYDFVAASLKPRPRKVSCLRGTNVPIARKAMAIYPQHPFTPVTEIEKGVVGMFDIECSAPERGTVWLVFMP